MKVPTYIKKAIRNKAKAGEVVQRNDAIIQKWFQENKMQNDSVFDPYIDSTETGYDPEGFIEILEKELFDFGNDRAYDDE